MSTSILTCRIKTNLISCRYSGNSFLCVDTTGSLATCANNCLGVDPNAIVVGGTALVTAATVGSIGLLNTFGIGAAGFGVLVSCPRLFSICHVPARAWECPAWPP